MYMKGPLSTQVENKIHLSHPCSEGALRKPSVRLVMKQLQHYLESI